MMPIKRQALPALLPLLLASAFAADAVTGSAEAQTRLESEETSRLSVIRQIGDVATAVSGERAGTLPSAIEQIGTGSSVVIVQGGEDNLASVTASEDGGRAVILQEGAGHRAGVRQSGPAAGLVVQSGAGHAARVEQDGAGGVGNSAVVLQSGLQNTARVSQSTISGALFRGAGREEGNSVTVEQRGSFNDASSEQTGQGNSALLRQDGFNNAIGISQDGDKTIAVRQTGVGHVFRFDQMGSDTAPMVVTQEGFSAPPVTVTRTGP
ncbi:MAG: hypothetical protein AAFP17_16670 [Pseudomonadota bacterium]